MCKTCRGTIFPDLNEYKNHIKSDWHKDNLRKKMKGEDGLNKEEFLTKDFMEKMELNN